MAIDFSVLERVPTIGQRIREADIDIRREAEQNMLRQQAQEDRTRKLQREQQLQDVYKRTADLIRQHGKDPDNPQHLQEGLAAATEAGSPQMAAVFSGMLEAVTKRRQTAEERARVAAIMGGQPPGAPPAPAAAAAPLAAPADQLTITPTTMVEPRGARPEMPAPGISARPQPVAAVPEPVPARTLPPVSDVVGRNALAPAAAVAAPVNALPTPAANPRLAALETEIDVKERQRAALLRDNSPEALKLATALQADLSRLDREYQRLQPKAEGADIQGYRLAQRQGFKGSFVEYQQAKRPVTKIELPPQEKAEKAKRGEFLVEQYKGVSDAARLASKTLPALDTQAKILDKGFETGFGTDAKKAAASVLAALGVPEAKEFATDAQTFLAATQQAVLTRQLEQKGPQTESDAQRITQTGAQLGNTPEANRFIIDVARAQLKRDIQQRNFYDSWWKKKETYDGAEDAWFSGEGGKSLFDRPELKKYAAPAAAPATAPAAAQAPAGAGPYSDPDKERRYQEWKRSQGMQ